MVKTSVPISNFKRNISFPAWGNRGEPFCLIPFGPSHSLVTCFRWRGDDAFDRWSTGTTILFHGWALSHPVSPSPSPSPFTPFFSPHPFSILCLTCIVDPYTPPQHCVGVQTLFVKCGPVLQTTPSPDPMGVTT